MFIVFEGPNGVGKSTLINLVSESLKVSGRKILLTKEPTVSELGIFIRNHQNTFTKETLACLVAANRYEHLYTIVEPAIARGEVVLSDRYFPSSLVYQQVDGLSPSFIEGLNQKIRVPDLTIFLTASEKTLVQRLAERAQLTRFEHDQGLEVKMYRDACEFLHTKNWKVLSLNVETMELSVATKFLVDRINSLF